MELFLRSPYISMSQCLSTVTTFSFCQQHIQVLLFCFAGKRNSNLLWSRRWNMQCRTNLHFENVPGFVELEVNYIHQFHINTPLSELLNFCTLWDNTNWKKLLKQIFRVCSTHWSTNFLLNKMWEFSSNYTLKKPQCLSITKKTWLMLFRKIVAVLSDNHSKPKNTLCGQNSVTENGSTWLIHVLPSFKDIKYHILKELC
jgi:hypothetical protein